MNKEDYLKVFVYPSYGKYPLLYSTISILLASVFTFNYPQVVGIHIIICIAAVVYYYCFRKEVKGYDKIDPPTWDLYCHILETGKCGQDPRYFDDVVRFSIGSKRQTLADIYNSFNDFERKVLGVAVREVEKIANREYWDNREREQCKKREEIKDYLDSRHD